MPFDSICRLSCKMSLAAPLLSLCLFAVARADSSSSGARQADPLLPYAPSLTGNMAIGGITSALFLVSLFYIFSSWPRVDKWALNFTFGAGLVAIGSWARIWLRTNQHDVLIYQDSTMLLFIAPSFLIAFNYHVFARFLAAIDGHRGGSVPPVNADKVKMVFITSNYFTAFIVMTGASLTLNTHKDLVDQGTIVYFIGTTLQSIFYSLFTMLIFHTHTRMYQQDPKRFSPFSLREPCVQLLYLLYLSGMPLLIRNSYRLAESIIGFDGYLSTHEVSPVATLYSTDKEKADRIPSPSRCGISPLTLPFWYSQWHYGSSFGLATFCDEFSQRHLPRPPS